MAPGDRHVPAQDARRRAVEELSAVHVRQRIEGPTIERSLQEADLLLRLGRFDETRTVLGRVVRAVRREHPPPPPVAEELAYLIAVYVTLGGLLETDVRGAQTWLDRSLTVCPASLDALCVQTMVYSGQGRLDEAADSLSRAAAVLEADDERTRFDDDDRRTFAEATYILALRLRDDRASQVLGVIDRALPLCPQESVVRTGADATSGGFDIAARIVGKARSGHPDASSGAESRTAAGELASGDPGAVSGDADGPTADVVARLWSLRDALTSE